MQWYKILLGALAASIVCFIWIKIRCPGLLISGLVTIKRKKVEPKQLKNNIFNYLMGGHQYSDVLFRHTFTKTHHMDKEYKYYRERNKHNMNYSFYVTETYTRWHAVRWMSLSGLFSCSQISSLFLPFEKENLRDTLMLINRASKTNKKGKWAQQTSRCHDTITLRTIKEICFLCNQINQI